MATEAQIHANRLNAQKSTGPKSAVGKARARLNALGDGRRARTVFPVLPQEDPKELDARIRQYFEDLQPRNILERELVARVARLSWQIERGERFEAAHLAKRVRAAQSDRRAKAAARVSTLTRRLLYNAGPREVPGAGPPWEDDPEAFLAELEGSMEGCRWLLRKWIEFRNLLEVDEQWVWNDGFRFIRLQGKYPSDGIDDPDLNRIFLAWDTMGPKAGQEFWEEAMRCTPAHDPGFHEFRGWRVIADEHESEDAAVEFLGELIDDRIAHYEELIGVHEETAGQDAIGRADAASFDMSPGFARFRRSQASLTRELGQTLDQLAKFRKSWSVVEGPKSLRNPGSTTIEPNPSRPSRRRRLSVVEESTLDIAHQLARVMHQAPGTNYPLPPSPKPEEAEAVEDTAEVATDATIEANSPETQNQSPEALKFDGVDETGSKRSHSRAESRKPGWAKEVQSGIRDDARMRCEPRASGDADPSSAGKPD